VPVWMSAADVDTGIELIDVVAPFGLDVTEGVRADGRVQAEALLRFFAGLRDEPQHHTPSASHRRASGA